jgi:hypothetical protein
MTLLIELETLIKAGQEDKVREILEEGELCKDLINFNTSVFPVATLLNLGSEMLMCICLGVLAKKIIRWEHAICELNLWVLASSVFSRPNVISDNSPCRISLLGLLMSENVDWKTKWWEVLVPYVDNFLINSLSKGNPLIQEQTVDFLGMCKDYSYASRPLKIIEKYKWVTQPILDKVDVIELQQEYREGIEHFLSLLSTHPKTQEEMVNYVFEEVESNQEIEQLKSNILKLYHKNNKE